MSNNLVNPKSNGDVAAEGEDGESPPVSAKKRVSVVDPREKTKGPSPGSFAARLTELVDRVQGISLREFHRQLLQRTGCDASPATIYNWANGTFSPNVEELLCVWNTFRSSGHPQLEALSLTWLASGLGEPYSEGTLRASLPPELRAMLDDLDVLRAKPAVAAVDALYRATRINAPITLWRLALGEFEHAEAEALVRLRSSREERAKGIEKSVLHNAPDVRETQPKVPRKRG